MHRRSFSWIVLAVALVAVAALASPSRACAQGGYTGFGDTTGIAIGLASVPSAFVVGMAVADTVSFALDTPFSTALAVGDLVTGGLTVITAAIFLGVAVNSAVQGWATDPVPFGAVGAVLLAFGSYEIAHGIWSLVSLGTREPPPVAIAPVPIDGGMMVTTGGAF